MCLNYRSEKSCVYGDTCRFRHVEAEGKPNKKSKKGGAKGSVTITKEFTQFRCVSQDSHPRNSFLREPGKIGTKRAVKFLQRHRTKHIVGRRRCGAWAVLCIKHFLEEWKDIREKMSEVSKNIGWGYCCRCGQQWHTGRRMVKSVFQPTNCRYGPWKTVCNV